MRKLTLHFFLVTCFLASSFLFFSCKSKFEKLRLSDNMAEKYTQAVAFYNAEKYEKAYILFEDLIRQYRGRDNSDQLYYYFAYTQYRQKDYVSARYHFKNLADTYPKSLYAEEARFMAAFTYYLTSPKITLDQGDTYKAIENLNYFIYLYPESDLVQKCRRYIEKLEDKLQRKSLLLAKLYYNLGNYKASSVAYKNTLLDYPDSTYAEEIFFEAFKSQFLYAEGSLLSLQFKRFEEAVEMYNDFIYRFPDSIKYDEATEMKRKSEVYLVQFEEEQRKDVNLLYQQINDSQNDAR